MFVTRIPEDGAATTLLKALPLLLLHWLAGTTTAASASSESHDNATRCSASPLFRYCYFWIIKRCVSPALDTVFVAAFERIEGKSLLCVCYIKHYRF